MILIGIYATMIFFNQYLGQENFKEKANGVASACAKHSTDPPQCLFQTQAQTLGETRRKGFCIWGRDGPTGRAGPHYPCSPRTLFLGRKAPWGREPPTHSPDSGHAVIHLPSHPQPGLEEPVLQIANTVWNKVLTLTRYPVLILHFYEYSTDFSTLKNKVSALRLHLAFRPFQLQLLPPWQRSLKLIWPWKKPE